MTTAISKVNYTHEALIEMIIAEPTATQGQLAARFGYSEGWISQIISSDAFQARLALRREEVVNPLLLQNLDDRIKGLANRSAEVLMAKLNQPLVSDQVATKAFELSTRALGYGAQSTPPAPPQPLDKLADNIIVLFNKTKEELKHVTVYEHSERCIESTTGPGNSPQES